MHTRIQHAPHFEAYFKKKIVLCCSSLQIIFLKKYNSILKSSSSNMIFTQCKLFNVLLLEDALSFMSFSSVSLHHDFFTTPVTFMIEETWKRTWPRDKIQDG